MSVELLGFNIDNYSFDEAVVRAKNMIDGHKVSQVVTINPEMLQYAEKDADFANIIKEAEMLLKSYTEELEKKTPKWKNNMKKLEKKYKNSIKLNFLLLFTTILGAVFSLI